MMVSYGGIFSTIIADIASVVDIPHFITDGSYLVFSSSE